MNHQFLTTYDECGDFTVRGGWVISRDGSMIRVGPRAVPAAPSGQRGTLSAIDTLGTVYVGGSGRNLVMYGFPEGGPNGVWRHGYPGHWSFGGFTLVHDSGGGATISDATDVVAILLGGGPDGDFTNTTYGEGLLGAPFLATAELETGWPGTLPDAVLTTNAANVKPGLYVAEDAANFAHETDPLWRLKIDLTTAGELIYDGTTLATRTGDYDNDDPSGAYESTEDGLAFNPRPHEPLEDEDFAVNPYGVLTIVYSWAGSPDLDTGTSFLGATAGFAYPGGDYLDWSGDETGTGEETVIIDLAQAWEDGHLGAVADVLCAADWFPSAGGSGPAALDVTYSLPGFTPVAITLRPGITSPATTLAAALRITAAGTLETNFQAWDADVIRLRVPPPEGFVYLKITEVDGMLDAVDGPFFAAALPANTSTQYHLPLAESDGEGGVETYYQGPVFWQRPPQITITEDDEMEIVSGGVTYFAPLFRRP